MERGWGRVAAHETEGLMAKCISVWLLLLLLHAHAAGAQPGTLAPLGVLAEAVDTVELSGQYLYTSAGRTIAIYDLRNPSSPARQGAYTFPEEVWTFSIEGSRAYVGANFFGLGILDVSNPAAPVLVGSFKTPGQAKAAAVAHGKAAVIDHMEGLVFVDVSNPAKPSGLGTYFLDGYARDVVTTGSMAYAVDSPAGLYVVDLSKPGPLEPVGSVQSGTNLRMLDVFDQATPGQPLLAVLAGGGALQVYDVSKPQAPVKLSTLRTPGTALRVALRGTRAYVADGPAGVQVVDLSNPASPTILASHATPSPTRDVAVGGGVVVAATTDSILVLRDLP